MTDFDPFERRLAAALRSDADLSVDPFEGGRIARAAIAGTRPVRRFGPGRGLTLLAAAAVLLVGATLAAGSGVLRQQGIVPPFPAPSFRVAIASPNATSPSPSKLATASPSPTAVPTTWTTASLKGDWPAPVRTEPAGRPLVVPILWTSNDKFGHLADPTGDTGSDTVPWGDIKNVGFCGICVNIDFVSWFPDGMDPSQQWFAYGIVVDTDGDGVPDWRYGIENVPMGTWGDSRPSPYRWWRTDLHTGQTESTGGDGGPFWGNHGSGSGRSGLSFGGDVTGGGEFGSLPKRFYAWASVIQDGRVVATDYAPDAGWLVPSAKAKP